MYDASQNYPQYLDLLLQRKITKKGLERIRNKQMRPKSKQYSEFVSVSIDAAALRYGVSDQVRKNRKSMRYHSEGELVGLGLLTLGDSNNTVITPSGLETATQLLSINPKEQIEKATANSLSPLLMHNEEFAQALHTAEIINLTTFPLQNPLFELGYASVFLAAYNSRKKPIN